MEFINVNLDFVWKNYPSGNTPLDEVNLNKMNTAINLLSSNDIYLEQEKATKLEVSSLIQDVTYDDKTGVLTFVRKNGAQPLVIDLPTEMIQTGIYYDIETEKLILPLINGTTTEVDLSRLITEYEFLDSDTIAIHVGVDGKVSAIIKEGSIQEKHLRPDYLADIRAESAKAEESSKAAALSEENAKYSEESAAESAENSKNSSDISKLYLTKVEEAGNEAVNKIKDALDMDAPEFQMDLSTGHLMYNGGRFVFQVNSNGHLEWGLAV